MSEVYLSYNNIISSYGFDSEAAVKGVKNNVTGLQLINNKQLLPEPFYAAITDKEKTSGRI